MKSLCALPVRALERACNQVPHFIGVPHKLVHNLECPHLCPQRETVRVCISSGNADECETALDQAYGRQLSFECVEADSDEDCLKQIKEGTADLTVVGGELLWLHVDCEVCAKPGAIACLSACKLHVEGTAGSWCSASGQLRPSCSVDMPTF